MDLRFLLAILVGKTIAFLIKLKGGGATAAPGLYALKIDPGLVGKFSRQINKGSIIVSGTNGKTTTARLIADILRSKFKLIHNRQGSNLLRGIASTFIANGNLLGKVDFDWALWEVDEATLPEAIDSVLPKVIVLLNLFRDQLDRYGEVDKVRRQWQEALEKLTDTVLILNADDPQIAFLARSYKGERLFFGVEQKYLHLPEINHVADIRYCLNCSARLKYTILFSAHMGHYFCKNCSFKRPTPKIFASHLDFKQDFSTDLQVTFDHLQLAISLNLPGLYNVYNLLGAATCAKFLKIDGKTIKNAVEEFSAAFGRFQKLQVKDKKIVVFLIKNPAGANEVLRILAVRNKVNFLAILNDNIADGRDVSWIWDTNWEIMVTKAGKIAISGNRSWDLATRLKYAGFKLDINTIHTNIFYSISRVLRLLSKNDTLVILPTYTALLDVQKSLNRMGATVKWHEQ